MDFTLHIVQLMDVYIAALVHLLGSNAHNELGDLRSGEWMIGSSS